jgi:RNA polymerase sigma-70 factor (ECF subfamily)
LGNADNFPPTIRFHNSTRLMSAALTETAELIDQGSFQKLVEAHRAELLAHCYRFTGSLHDAEDLVQETFLRAWRGIKGFEGRSSLRSWLYRIATNACLNAGARKASARRVFPEDVSGPTTRMPAERAEKPKSDSPTSAWSASMNASTYARTPGAFTSGAACGA